MGSVNGVICMTVFDTYRNLVYLWNPATRESKEIPEPLSSIVPNNRVRLHAFGYDSKTCEYKLVVGTQTQGNTSSTLIQVYTLGSNSWKTGTTIPYWFPGDQRSGLVYNGYFHWIAVPRGQQSNILLSFDISGESFQEMHLPRELLDQDMFVGELEGCLCAVVSSSRKVNFEVWKMVDYGVRESWNKCYVIAHQSIFSTPKILPL